MTRLASGAALAACLLACSIASPKEATPQTVTLWPGQAPGAVALAEETVRVTEQGERVVSNVHAPSLTVYLPKTDDRAAAVIVVPGGGHRELWTDHEGHNVARFLNENGIAAFVLKYRLARAPNSSYGIETHALDDLEQAIRTVRVRAHSGEWAVDPAKVGIMGFSAGGQLALLGAMRFDAGNPRSADFMEGISARPDFVALVYPGPWPELKFDANTPPMFLLSGSDDRPQVLAGLTQIFAALRAAQVPAEMHLYDGVPHGFGLRAGNSGPVAQWPRQFVEWLRFRKVL